MNIAKAIDEMSGRNEILENHKDYTAGTKLIASKIKHLEWYKHPTTVALIDFLEAEYEKHTNEAIGGNEKLASSQLISMRLAKAKQCKEIIEYARREPTE